MRLVQVVEMIGPRTSVVLVQEADDLSEDRIGRVPVKYFHLA